LPETTQYYQRKKVKYQREKFQEVDILPDIEFTSLHKVIQPDDVKIKRMVVCRGIAVNISKPMPVNIKRPVRPVLKIKHHRHARHYNHQQQEQHADLYPCFFNVLHLFTEELQK
jgi:hypothetical protein